ncbi:MAG: AraC family transcriptional regulator, partial [Clostridia bacterium]|nr:AraC family transcriptional regulator [Clostridia bacterium]
VTKMKEFKAESWSSSHPEIFVFSGADDGGELHTHDFIEIVYCKQGKAVQTVNGESYDFCRGDMLFINYGSTHSFTNTPDYKYINICFYPETVGNAIVTEENAFAVLSLTSFNELRGESDHGVVSFKGNEMVEVENILSAMLLEQQEQRPFGKKVTENYLNVLFTMILRKSFVVGDGQTDGWNVILEEINKDLYGVKLQTLAEKCFYNPAYFCRAFKEKFNMTLKEYVTKKRIERAVELIKTTNLTLDDIAEKTGYSSRSGLYRAFIKVRGVSPNSLREEKE